MVFLITAAIILCLVTGLFFIAQIRKDNSIVDIFWGIGFVVIAISTLVQTGNVSLRPLITSILVAVWGLRLAGYIFIRNKGQGEDYRYIEMRKRWGRHQALGAYLNVFLLQGILMLLISLPVQITIIYSTAGLGFTDYLGIAVWITGFIFEAGGDAQLRNFKKDPANKGRIMKTGLWSLTRHPNYFGEIVMWWGIFLLSLKVPFAAVSVIGPVLITFFLMKVSGVPMLEKKYKDNPEYREYINTVPALFPKIF